MAILVEALSVVIKDISLNKKSGRFENFIYNLPNKTWHSDGKIHCVSFMDPSSVRQYCDYLVNTLKLKWYDQNNRAIDFVVVDMLTGSTTDCEWLNFKREKIFADYVQFKMKNEDFSIVWLVNSYKGVKGEFLNSIEYHYKSNFEADGISFSQSWTPDNAIYSSDFSNNPNNEFEVIEADGINVILKNKETQEIKYSAKPIIDGETKDFFLIKKSAESGNSDDQCHIGLMYFTGSEIEKDITKAKFWLEKSASQKNALALYSLSVFYKDGIATTIDLKKEFELVSRSAEIGNVDAQFNLSKIYRLGNSVVNQNTEKAIFWLKKCVEQNDSEAMWNLGDLLFKGEGSFINKEEGLNLIKKSAALGNEVALLSLKIGRYENLLKVKKMKKSWIKRLFK